MLFFVVVFDVGVDVVVVVVAAVVVVVVFVVVAAFVVVVVIVVIVILVCFSGVNIYGQTSDDPDLDNDEEAPPCPWRQSLWFD